MVGYIFGGDTQETPESLKRKREIAAAMLARSSAPQNVGEGLNAIGNAIVYRGMMGDVAKGETAGRKSADEAFAPIAALLGGGSPSPSTIPMSGAAAEIGAGAPTPVKPGGVPEISDYIKQAAIARGIDPDIALRVAGHEGLNVFDPSKPDNGGDEGSSFGPFQLHYAGMSKSMPNAGLGDEFTKATGLHARDPSTWKQQVDFSLDWAKKNGWSPWMGAKAEGITGMMGIGNAPQPRQVASLDPSAGMPMPGATGQMHASDPAQPIKPPAAPSLPAPTTVASPPTVAPQTQVAQALMSQPAVDIGAVSRALNNPFLSPGQRAVAESILKQEMDRRNALYELQLQQSDPKYRQDLEKGSIELENLRHPKVSPADQERIDLERQKFDFEKSKPSEVGGRLIGPDGKVIYEPPRDPMKVGAKETVIDPTSGKVIYQPTPGQAVDFNDVSSLRKEIQQLPSYKNLSQALPIYQSMAETAGRNSKASDLNLVYGLGKIMDPNSVVREGEMVMVKNTASLPDWLQGAIASLNGGAALTPETRQAIMTEAFGRVQGYDNAFKQDTTQYRGIVERNKFNPEDVIPSFGTYQPWKSAAVPEGDVPPAPEGVDAEDWKYLTPEQRRLWQK